MWSRGRKLFSVMRLMILHLKMLSQFLIQFKSYSLTPKFVLYVSSCYKIKDDSNLESSSLFCKKINYAYSSFACFAWSSISLRCISNGTGAYSKNPLLNFARPCVMERSDDE